MSDYHSIKVPHESVNDDYVTIVKWHVTNGQQVVFDDLIFEFETSKSIEEVRAEAAGFVTIIEKVGAKVEIGKEIGRLHDQPQENLSDKVKPLPGVLSQSKNVSEQENTQSLISREAQILIDTEGLDPTLFSGLKVVKASDIRAFLSKNKNELQMGEFKDKEIASHNDNRKKWNPKGIFSDAISSANDRGRGLIWLGINYLFRIYILGLLVRVAPRGIILFLHRLRGIKIGKYCFIDPTAILETAYPENITLGNDVRIAAQAIIMTHIKAPHYLRDTEIIPLTLKKVVLEDHCFIGVNSVIMPGVTVGKAAVVASGTVVTANVPPYTMIAGNPSKIIKKFSQ